MITALTLWFGVGIVVGLAVGGVIRAGAVDQVQEEIAP